MRSGKTNLDDKGGRKASGKPGRTTGSDDKRPVI
jgi:hypothetical protein